MPWIIAGGTLAAGYLANEGASSAGDAGAAATAEERRQFDLTWDANAPARSGAQNALGNMALIP